MILTRRHFVIFALLAAVVLGLAASCGDTGGGMHQGGGDSVPHWR